MILCPNCKHREISGAFFCSNCGTQLVIIPSETQQIQDPEISSETEENLNAPGKYLSSTWGTLHLVDNNIMIPLAEIDEFSLGRVGLYQPVLPDIDLTAYEAHSKGVSRLHCVLKKRNNKTIIVDLASANGTFLNGQRIPPHIETLVNNGDVITLGRLRINFIRN